MEEIFGRIINQASHQMGRAMDAYAHQLGITGMQLSVIDYIATVDFAPIQHDVELEFNIQRATATVLLQRMERDAIIVRLPSPTDARQKLIKLTDHGQTLARDAAQYIGAQQQAMHDHFSPAEIATFKEVLTYFKDLSNQHHQDSAIIRSKKIDHQN